jgi:hypothetical protein
MNDDLERLLRAVTNLLLAMRDKPAPAPETSLDELAAEVEDLARREHGETGI